MFWSVVVSIVSLIIFKLLWTKAMANYASASSEKNMKQAIIVSKLSKSFRVKQNNSFLTGLFKPKYNNLPAVDNIITAANIRSSCRLCPLGASVGSFPNAQNLSGADICDLSI